MDIFFRLMMVGMFVWYLTESPDKLTEDEPAPQYEATLEIWQRSALRGGDDWWQIQFLYAYFNHMGLISDTEYKTKKGFIWHHVYRRACGRPVPYSEDHYFGHRVLHPKP